MPMPTLHCPVVKASASWLLLCEAVDCPEPPDERAAVDANHLPASHDTAQDA